MNDDELLNDDGDVLELQPEQELDDQVEGEGEPDDGDDAEPSGDNTAIRALRARNRELTRQLREREQAEKPKPEPIDVGPRPRLADPGIDYDEAKLEQAENDWLARRDAAQEAKRLAEQEDSTTTATQQQRIEAEVSVYKAAKEAFDVEDADEVIGDVERAFANFQQLIVVRALGEKAPAVLYRIGRDPDLMDRLADIDDPILFTAAITRLENAQMPKSRPAIDAPVKGKPAAAGTADKELARLEKEAERTGDRTALIRYRKQMGK